MKSKKKTLQQLLSLMSCFDAFFLFFFLRGLTVPHIGLCHLTNASSTCYSETKEQINRLQGTLSRRCTAREKRVKVTITITVTNNLKGDLTSIGQVELPGVTQLPVRVHRCRANSKIRTSRAGITGTLSSRSKPLFFSTFLFAGRPYSKQ